MVEALVQELADGLKGRTALLIAGPTASGKSALALDLAEATGGVVINADSMQLYGGLRILTARPTVEEEARAAHMFYGTVDPSIAFSVGDYMRMVAPVLAELAAAQRPAIVVGGTGLYFRALTEGLVETPEIAPEIVAEVEAMTLAGIDLRQHLAALDPITAARLKPADTGRLQRALAVSMGTGRPLSAWQAEVAPPILPPESWQGVFIAPERAELYARINSRFDLMLQAGALDEARAIRALNLPTNRGVMKSHGMPHLIAHLEGRMAIEEAARLGQQDTRNYAKRQFTWAKKYMADWRWIKPPSHGAG
jgi:tRNA dimethylallyltransferase